MKLWVNTQAIEEFAQLNPFTHMPTCLYLQRIPQKYRSIILPYMYRAAGKEFTVYFNLRKQNVTDN